MTRRRIAPYKLLPEGGIVASKTVFPETEHLHEGALGDTRRHPRVHETLRPRDTTASRTIKRQILDSMSFVPPPAITASRRSAF